MPRAPSQSEVEFAGTARFALLDRLGEGGMGNVYAVHDRELGMDVALKTLRWMDAASLHRFKREFRALADVSHPHLVQLYELVADGDLWFFTMELVDGVDFLSYVRGWDDRVVPGRRRAVSTPREDGDEVETVATRALSITDPGDGGPAPLDETRLRSALRQLASGVATLHRRGLLHRDIKPSNVMVTRDGRVVLLDFGVITEVAGPRWRSDTVEVVGTPVYMAPEQARGEPTMASDWYSVGAVLYDALAGKAPFRGGATAVLKQKQLAEPAPPHLHRDDLPADLEQLCVQLLATEPTRRPTPGEILERLGAGRATTDVSVYQQALIGRRDHAEALQAALASAQSGAGNVIYVHGTSGMGKTALVRGFLRDVAADARAVVLEGRCYERESVPYKAVDSLIDSLCQFLLQLPRHETDALLPRDVQSLARVFPVLRRIEAVSTAHQRTAAAPDPRELRRRGFAALRDLLGRLAERRPLVLFIDDLQWGDVDSAALLQTLMQPPDVPPLLLVLSYRSDEEQRSPLLRELLSASPEAHKLEVGPLSEGGARQLAAELLRHVDVRPDAVEVIARESAGNPYFIRELAMFLRGDAAAEMELTFDALIQKRVDRLDRDARRVLELVCVAGSPLTAATLQRAAELSAGDVMPLVTMLVQRRLVTASGAREHDFIEPYHDRIRETVVAMLAGDDLRHRHHRLAVAIRGSGDADPETLANHFHAAGEAAAAVEYAMTAARKAMTGLAFDRAASLYRLVLELLPTDSADAQPLHSELGQALFYAGRGAEAAHAFLSSAQLTSGVEALDLRRRAGEQLLRSGYIDEGLDTLRMVLDEAGMALPRTPIRGIGRLLWYRARLRLRRLRLRQRDPGTVSARERLLVDLCWSVATGLSQVDPARAGCYATRMVLLAMAVGDPHRMCRALALEAAFVAAVGNKTVRRAKKLSDVAEAIANEVDDVEALTLVEGTRAFATFEQGRFRAAHEECELALKHLRERCHGVAWHVGSMQHFSLASLVNLGEMVRLRELAPRYLAEAQAVDDQYTVTNIRALTLPPLLLADDDPEAARREAREAMERWSDSAGFHNQHFMAVVMLANVDLYEGKGADAWQRCMAADDKVRRAFLMFVQVIRGAWLDICGRSALAAAVASADGRRGLVKRAERYAHKLAREQPAWCAVMAAMLRAGIATLRGDRDAAIAGFDQAITANRTAHLDVIAAAARLRLGQLTGGERGEALICEATESLTARGITNVHDCTRGFAPIDPADGWVDDAPALLSAPSSQS